jgi:hypothetical protein
MTLVQMEEKIAHRFMNELNVEADVALRRAQEALGHLIQTSVLTEWGVNPEGEILYVPAPSQRRPQAVVYIW